MTQGSFLTTLVINECTVSIVIHIREIYKTLYNILNEKCLEEDIYAKATQILLNNQQNRIKTLRIAII